MKRRLRISSSMLACSMTLCGGCVSIDPSTWDDLEPRRYLCHRVESPITIDGRLDDAQWQTAPWTEPFGDIEGPGRPMPRHQTRARLLWDDEYLYICVWMDEPHLWAALTRRDAVIWHDNDIEVFVDPDGDTLNYFEIEVNARNVIFDLFLVRPYNQGGPALHDWNMSGLVTAVHLDGTLNDPTDTDVGWSVELALPWRGFQPAVGRRTPPGVGDVWRLNFSRVQWRLEVADNHYSKVPDTREDNWSWSPQGAINMHLPERWGFVEFIGPPGSLSETDGP